MLLCLEDCRLWLLLSLSLLCEDCGLWLLLLSVMLMMINGLLGGGLILLLLGYTNVLFVKGGW